MRDQWRRNSRLVTLVRTAVLALPLAPGPLWRPAHAQSIRFDVGVSGSWGANSGTICTLTCGPGMWRTHADLVAPTAGIALTSHVLGPVKMETGLVLTRKGWAVTGPPLRTVYLEVPVLVHLGYWPRAPGFGFSVGGGAALDLGWPRGEDSQVATLFDAGVHATKNGRSLWSLSVRMARGINTIHSFHVHTLALMVGYSPG